ncbi:MULTISPECIES: lipoate--protein ligase family protein [unclassified Arthrobacter]|uniref:lipoate--protein ligase family protein n=1 Tax=unclassified Arthrobacter TaxID=235627 RepID=UPI001D156C7D|nr:MULTISPECIES: biotin/lipoate A/B protein ligase family protein [unclassified Arthrobacter]MCC3274740.1 lipoate--protein ligase family protein [Arthrobacter sp. zg-Y20]MCC3279290.1 lipoate--protein ligase family protein [Arthrobacter sp. zg-Y40]MCC9177667.1 lipoate--protein ligase family protein [Arthrobacter sp. zg-Y750]MDK1314896.1 biotin/lipoate A/B protein ligase family protein [Arthrobacter sp. zg.Y20]MDK1327758.1 biotin/lipoate A/B protein ligase family protein [Arthrobacter sp. zg-Y11
MASADGSFSRRHGEYKVPGGKLVVVDLDVRDGRLADVSLGGDFFLEPDEALLDINAALEGLPAETGFGDIAAAVHARLSPDAVLFGFSPEAVATAVRRALGKATGWGDHQWEIIPPTPLSTHMHVAMDEVLAEEVGAGHRNPTLRFWEWETPSVVIGSFQSLKNEVDPAGAERHGVTVVRRITGGGAMFMEHGNAITYSLYVPQSLVDGLSFADSYPFLDAWVMESLKKLGIQAWYVPLNDMATDQGKIGGAAQKRFSSGGMLHHVTMSYNIDADKMVEVLRIGKEKLSDKGTTSAKKRVDPLKRQTGLSREEIIATMIDTFTARYGAVQAGISDEEMDLAEQKVKEKFDTAEWLNRVP